MFNMVGKTGRSNMSLKSLFRRKFRLVLLVVIVYFCHAVIFKSVKDTFQDVQNVHHSRSLLSLPSNHSDDLDSNESETEKKCNPPAMHEFPKDLFSNNQRKQGAILIHIFTAIYMFLALALVCDDYFVASLDKICERLHMSEDVAGATFMAAGSSAPELFTSIIGVFVTGGDVGIGTIVGSAVFNILCILALCGLFAGQVVELTWYPLCRDSAFYSFSIVALIATIYDGYVTWYESVIMLLMYLAYCIIMKYNESIVRFIEKRKKKDVPEVGVGLMEKGEAKTSEAANNSSEERISMKGKRRPTWRELGMMIMLSEQFAPASRLRAAFLIVVLRQDLQKENGMKDAGICVENSSDWVAKRDSSTEEVKITKSQCTPMSLLKSFFWVVTMPLATLLYITVPDCRKKKWERWYIVTFCISIFWIAAFSYLMVWMVVLIGYTWGIPDVIMGVVFLAAGTSVPDAISSLLVARQGQGDMAVSNSIGSNVFDILLGLAIPWFIKTAIVTPGSSIAINSRGMVYSVLLLFGSVIVTIACIHLNKWRLSKRIGLILAVLYVAFIVMSSLIEFNTFGFVNLPTCRYK